MRHHRDKFEPNRTIKDKHFQKITSSPEINFKINKNVINVVKHNQQTSIFFTKNNRHSSYQNNTPKQCALQTLIIISICIPSISDEMSKTFFQ